MARPAMFANEEEENEETAAGVSHASLA